MNCGSAADALDGVDWILCGTLVDAGDAFHQAGATIRLLAQTLLFARYRMQDPPKRRLGGTPPSTAFR